MTTESNLEKATKKVVEVFNGFAKNQKQEFLKAVQKALQDDKAFQDNKENKIEKSLADKLKLIIDKLWLLIFVMTFSALIFSVLIYANDEYRELKPSDLFQLIGFVFALSSYLASVARDTAKTLSNITDITDRVKYKTHIFYMATAEIPLVILGVLAIIRLIVGPITRVVPCINRCVSFDAFLLSLLAVILIRMAYLHARIWWEVEPWDVYKKKQN